MLTSDRRKGLFLRERTVGQIVVAGALWRLGRSKTRSDFPFLCQFFVLLVPQTDEGETK